MSKTQRVKIPRDLEPGRAPRRAEHREHRCAHGILEGDCDVCQALDAWQGARYRTAVECLEIEDASTGYGHARGRA